MDRELFASRFRSATEHARMFGQRFVIEELPERLCFHVVLNASFDGNPLHADERVFPEDGSVEKQLAIGRCREHEVIELLWRDGSSPEWIDVSVVGRLVDATLIEVLCCGRFTANDELLYHVQGGMPPFHVLGPTLPNDYVDGKKFSVLQRARCRTLDELAYLEDHAKNIWSLDLEGPSFDDEVLARLPKFRAMEVLELHAVPLRGPGLAGLDRQPKLRVLRIALHGSDTCSLEHVRRLRRLQSLSVKSRHPLVLADEWPTTLTELTLRAPRLHDAIVESLVERTELRFLDVRDTAVTMDCLRRIARRHPTIRISPEPLL